MQKGENRGQECGARRCNGDCPDLISLGLGLRWTFSVYCINELMRNGMTFVALLPQVIMWSSAVIEPNKDTLLLSRYNRRNEVTITGYKDGFLNRLLGRELNQVHSQENVNSLLFVPWSASLIVTPEFQTPQTHRVPGVDFQAQRRTCVVRHIWRSLPVREDCLEIPDNDSSMS